MKKPVQIYIQISAAEDEAIRILAEKAGMDRKSFLRHAFLKHVIEPAWRSGDWDEAMRERRRRKIFEAQHQ